MIVSRPKFGNTTRIFYGSYEQTDAAREEYKKQNAILLGLERSRKEK